MESASETTCYDRVVIAAGHGVALPSENGRMRGVRDRPITTAKNRAIRAASDSIGIAAADESSSGTASQGVGIASDDG